MVDTPMYAMWRDELKRTEPTLIYRELAEKYWCGNEYVHVAPGAKLLITVTSIRG